MSTIDVDAIFENAVGYQQPQKPPEPGPTSSPATDREADQALADIEVGTVQVDDEAPPGGDGDLDIDVEDILGSGGDQDDDEVEDEDNDPHAGEADQDEDQGGEPSDPGAIAAVDPGRVDIEILDTSHSFRFHRSC